MRNVLRLYGFQESYFDYNAANTKSLPQLTHAQRKPRFWRSICQLIGLYFLAVGYANAQCPAPYGQYSYGVTYNSAQLYWYTNGTDQGYEIDYRKQGVSTWTTVATTSQFNSLTGLAVSTTYEWRARAFCGSGVFSVYTTTLTFTTTGCVVPASPTAYNIGNTSARLSWATNGATYEVDYQQQGASNWTMVPVTTTPYDLTGLTTNTPYNWRVRSNCSGTFSAYTTPQSFTTGCQAPTAPTTSGVMAYSALLSWTSNNATNPGTTDDIDYRIQGASEWTTVTNPPKPYKLTGLSNNTTYQWRVRSNCGGGSLSSNSVIQTFTTACNPPTSINFTSVSYSSASANYSGGTPGATYEIDYRIQGSANWTTVTQTNTQISYFSLTGLSNNTAYECRMRSNCGGALSANSAVQSFTTSCKAPANVSVKANSFAADVTWTASATDVQFALQWRQGTGSWTTIPDITRRQYVLTGLTNGSAYQVQVQSVCGASSTTFTVPVSFTTACPVPTSLSFYANNVTSRDFRWLYNNGVNYELRWRPQGSATWNSSPLLNEGNSDSYSIPNGYSTYRINNLAAGAYDWQVRGVCAEGTTTAYTSGQSFTVIAPVSATCSTATPTSAFAIATRTAAVLRWAGDVGTAQEVRWRAQGSTTWNVATNLRTQVRATQTLQSPVLVLRDLQGSTTYEWQVRNLCPDNPATTFGSSQTFATTSCATLNTGTSYVSSTSALLGTSGVGVPYQDLLGLTNQDLGYQPEFNWRQVGASTWNVVPLQSSSTFSLTGLANNTAYEWRARNICSPTVTGEFSTPLSFTTQCVSASITSVLNSYCDMAVVYTSPATTSYKVNLDIRYRVVGASSWSVQSFTTGGQVNLMGLTGNTNYEIQVQNNCGAGTPDNYSNLVTFMTQVCSPTTCSPAGSVSPYDITTDAATVSVGGTALDLRWRQSGTAGWTTVPISATSTIQYRLTGLTPGTNYDLQARSACSIPTDFSPITYFKTGCNIPFSTTAVNIQATSADLSYNGFGSGVTYEIRYRTGANAWISATTSNTSTYALTGLTNSTTYEWQMRTLCSGGGTSNWSYSLFFTTPQCATPTSLFADRIDGTSARFNWFSPFAGATFTVQYRQQGNPTWTTVNGINSTNGGTNYVSTLTSYSVTGLSSQTTYEWQVLTNCGDGTSSSTVYQPLTFLTTAASGTVTCTSMVTVQNGNWMNPATWSCNRVPVATDPVQVLHNVTIPAGATGRAFRVNYGAAGNVSLGTAARLLLSQ